MRVTLHCAAVHKGTRVTFISIAYHILLCARSLATELPFHASGEASTTPASQARTLDLINDLLRSHLKQGFAQGLIATDSNIVLNPLRVNMTAIAQNKPLLFLVEGYIPVIGHWLAANRVSIK
jgi:hypothetical protein